MPIFWRDYVRPSEHLKTLRDRRRDVYERIDEQKFGWKVVIVAGAGFLTDAYDIFAVNMVLPMLEIVYWQNKLPASHETAINLATLVGTIIGQMTFGVLADRYGRKKMYGFELLIVIVATVGLALCSKGASGSVNIFAWVVSWRLLMGIGIGADYPLSAVIVSEFSPRRHRAQMLAAVFYMQPIGQLVANVIAIIATSISHDYIYKDADPFNCTGDCMETTDKIWRWIVGLGAVIPAITLVARFLIPESPRYLLEVEKDSNTAIQNSVKYFNNYADPVRKPGQVSAPPDPFRPNPRLAGTNEGDAAAPQGLPGSVDGLPQMPEVNFQYQQPHGISHPTGVEDRIEQYPDPFHLKPQGHGTGESTLNGGSRNSNPDSDAGKHGLVVGIESILPSNASTSQSVHANEKEGQSEDIHVQKNDAQSTATRNATAAQDNFKTRKASWSEFWRGFYVYLFHFEPVDETTTDAFNIPPQLGASTHPPVSGIRRAKWTDGNWTDLAGTSISWFLLDFSFFFLGVNSWKLIARVWDTPVYSSVYELIMQFSWRALISVSVSSIIGGALFIGMARYRHNIQMYGFLILAAFLIAVGVTFITILGGKYFAAVIVLYFFTQLFFDLGPNTSTFIIPAEVFPTQYRATCHGISAASGKLGSIIAQVIAQLLLNGNKPKRLGGALIGFSILMIIGAGVTKVWVPNPCDIFGESRSLEDLSKGKKARQSMEEEDREVKRLAEQERYGSV